jgi:hypothetical protein
MSITANRIDTRDQAGACTPDFAVAVAFVSAAVFASAVAVALTLLRGPHPQRRSQRVKTPQGRRAWMHVVFCRDMDVAS